MNTADIPRHIVIEGPIGVGKTSLARRLAEDYEGELLLEGAEENPFLERFYKNPRHAALPTQLFFLFQRARQMQAFSPRCASQTSCWRRTACSPSSTWTTTSCASTNRSTPASPSTHHARTW